MTVVRSIFTEAAVMTGSTVFARGLSFLSLILMTTALSRYDYGVFILALALVGPGLSVASLALDDVVVADMGRAIGQGQFGLARRLLVSFIRLRVGVLVGVIIIGWFLRGQLAASYGPVVSDAYWALAVVAICQHFRNTAQLVLQVSKDFRSAAILMGGEQLARVMLLSYLFFASTLTVHTALSITAAASAAAVLITLPAIVRFWRSLAGGPAVHDSVLRPLLRSHGFWQMLQAITSDIFGPLKYFIIYRLLSAEAVAITAIAQSIFSTATSLFPLKYVLFPNLSHLAHDRPSLQDMIRRVSRYAFYFYLVLAVVVAGGGGAILYSFFPEYRDAIPFLAIMSARLPYNAWSMHQSSVMTIFRKQKANYLVTIVSGLLMCVVLFVHIRWWGVLGIASEGLVTVGIVILVREWYIRRTLHVSILSWHTFILPNRQEFRSLFLMARNLLRIDGKRNRVV